MQQRSPASLPAPDAASAAHSVRVATFIRERIDAAGGHISFAEYMQHCLYAPGLGYYAAGATKFGAAGDFVTAPEVSTVFGQVLARQCALVLAETRECDVLEFGAGTGKLAVDLLTGLAELDALPMRYRIVEASADLQERQQVRINAEIPDLADRIEWLQELPTAHSGVVIANEVLDAMPVERFIKRAGAVRQICVAWDGDGFVLREQSAPGILADAVAALEHDLGCKLPDGYGSEVCLAVRPWVSDLADLLTDGIVFLFDYGVSRREYYGEERAGGWLRCHFRHHAHHDPLILAGIQDITAWVDFTAVAAAARACELGIVGFTNQALFLLGGGLAEVLGGMADLPLAAQLELSGQVKLLTLPGEMGENFKCLALRRGAISTPEAFLASDKTASL